MKIVIDITEKALDVLKNEGVDWLGAEHILDAVSKGIPYEERSHCECVEEIIEELESRKDYGAEYAQAMEDVITILKAKFDIDKEPENE